MALHLHIPCPWTGKVSIKNNTSQLLDAVGGLEGRMCDTIGLCIRKLNGGQLANVKLVSWKEVGTPLDENTQILKTEEIE